MKSIEWPHFIAEPLGSDALQLKCIDCNQPKMHVRQLLPERSGGRHRNRIVAVCSGCGREFRIKLGTFRSDRRLAACAAADGGTNGGCATASLLPAGHPAVRTAATPL